MLSLLISLVIVGLVVYVLLWGLGELGLPDPFAKIAKVIIILFAVVYLVNLLLPLAGVGKLGL